LLNTVEENKNPRSEKQVVVAEKADNSVKCLHIPPSEITNIQSDPIKCKTWLTIMVSCEHFMKKKQQKKTKACSE